VIDAALPAREIRSLRPPKGPVDPGRAVGWRQDVERGVRVEHRRALTVFLAGAECPFTCLFCDLWRHTLDGPTPPGALPRQLAGALEEWRLAARGDDRPAPAIKLYNASNFFDARAVPPEDDEAIARLCDPFARVTVETHPRLVGERCERLAGRLSGRLEIAMGLETVHPTVFPRLNKGMEPRHFDAAVAWARARGIGTRAFVLVGLPWVPAEEFAAWAIRSVEHAAEAGVDRVALIPLRHGNGALDRLAAEGSLGRVTLAHLEAALEGSLRAACGRIVVEADVWDARSLPACGECAPPRVERLRAANLAQAVPPAVECACGGHA